MNYIGFDELAKDDDIILEESRQETNLHILITQALEKLVIKSTRSINPFFYQVINEQQQQNSNPSYNNNKKTSILQQLNQVQNEDNKYSEDLQSDNYSNCQDQQNIKIKQKILESEYIGNFYIGNEKSYFNFQNQLIEDDKLQQYYDIKIVECIWDGVPSVMIMMLDVTQKVYFKWMQEVQGYKDLMLAQITHELRTPLNGIMSQLQASSTFTTIKEFQNCINITLKSADLLNSVISDILDHCQLLKGKLRLNSERFNVISLVDEVIELFSVQAQMKNIQIVKNIKQLPLEIQGSFPYYEINNDYNRLKQILLNLIGNALKFTQKGFIEIIIEQKLGINEQFSDLNQEKSDDYIKQNFCQISVRDTGVGIPKDIQSKLFQLYGTYEITKGSNRNGIGLGLTICKQLVQLLGPKQEFYLESKPSQGSTFRFLIYEELDLSKARCTSLNPHYDKQLQQMGVISQKCISLPKSLVYPPLEASSDKFQRSTKLKQPSIDIYLPDKQQSQIIKNSGYNKERLSIFKSQTFQQDLYFSHNIFSPQSSVPQVPYNFFNTLSFDQESSQSIQFDQIKQQNSQNSQNYKQLLKDILPKQQFKILAVDDNQFNLLGIVLYLFTFQFLISYYLGIKTLFQHISNIYIDTASDGKQAYDKIIENSQEKDKYLFILMDVNMPIMSGNECITKIRNQLNNYRYKIISLTAFQQEQDKKECLEAGADYFLNKPLTYQQLVNMMIDLF